MNFAGALAAARGSRDPDAFAALASVALKSQDEAEALPLVADAAARFATLPRLWQWTGLLHRALDDRGAAVAALEKAAALAPHDPQIAHARARAVHEAGGDSVDLFETARRLAPQDGGVLLGLAAAMHAAGNAVGARDWLAAVLRANPGWLDGHRDLIQLNWMTGGGAGSFDALRAAIAVAPAEAALQQQLVLSLIQADLHEDALEAIAAARAGAGDPAFLDFNEAIVRSRRGESEAADQLFAGFGDGNDPGEALHLIRHALRNGRSDRVARLIDRWIVDPGAAPLWPYASLVWRLTGDSRSDWLEAAAPVRVIDLGGKLPPLDRLAALLRGLHRARHQQLDQSVRGGTQTDGALFARIEPEIVALRAVVVTAVADYVAALPPPDAGHPTLAPRRDREPRFAGSWSVRLAGAGFHDNHVHPAGWISSALYVALPERRDGEDPRAGWLALGEPQAALGVNMPPQQLVEPKPRRLVLFPSWMWHGTLPFAEGERLTIAFDVARPV